MRRQYVYLAQPAHRFGRNAFLPYSAGRIWAYAERNARVMEKYLLGELLWDREPIDKLIIRMLAREREPAVFGFSTYIWNEQYNLALAHAVRRTFPNCLIVFGGPQVPEKREEIIKYMNANSFIDYLVHGEGEEVFADILLMRLDRNAGHVSYRMGADVFPGGNPARVENLKDLPSPYLNDTFDSIMEYDKPRTVDWQALQETDRGCPYACTFCVWGSASLNQVRTFDMDKLERELYWMAENGIEICYNCDANFGMLPHHEEFTDCLMHVSARKGYPKKFRAAYAKKITERVFRVAHKLSESGLSKGATISFQSMDNQVLGNVKRINPVAKSLSQTFERYNEAGISTYSELILGLPGETIDSFVNGIDQLLDAGQHRGLAVYPCMVLNNSELADPLYRELHGIKTVRVRQLLLHGIPDKIPEYYDLVVETSTMSFEHWRLAWRLAIVIQALHCSGVTDKLAMIARERGIKYTDFYIHLITMANRHANRSTEFSRLLRWVDYVIDEALKGNDWPTTFSGFGDIQWPIEEAFLLQLMMARDNFYRDMIEWTRLWCDAGDVVYQERLAMNPADWPSYIDFAREAVWYGRKGRKPVQAQPTGMQAEAR